MIKAITKWRISFQKDLHHPGGVSLWIYNISQQGAVISKQVSTHYDVSGSFMGSIRINKPYDAHIFQNVWNKSQKNGMVDATHFAALYEVMYISAAKTSYYKAQPRQIHLTPSQIIHGEVKAALKQHQPAASFENQVKQTMKYFQDRKISISPLPQTSPQQTVSQDQGGLNPLILIGGFLLYKMIK